MKYRIIKFDVFGDERGNLIALELDRAIPFEVKRLYYIWGTKYEVVRGMHAHKSLKQVIICVSGECDFVLDDGYERKILHMNNPRIGLYIENMIWREFTNFSKDCVVMVLASEHYDENDYIRDYSEFISMISDS